MTPLDPVAADAAELRAAFGRFPSGIAALCAEVDGEKLGLVASSFSVGVSFDPPLVMFSVQNSSTTWPRLRQASRIGVSVLGRDHAAACRQLASRRGDRFRDLDIVRSRTGALLLHGSAVWMECEILSENPAGDHAIVLLAVKEMRVDREMEPLVYHGAEFRQLAVAS
ncbi:flavin reductase family protein [Naasia sp. SYSU D00948]|uniref:flavin reductase family protein n=1 Tax=Naasia sp. SYSU D00948 TaxID=2817379 RepID=UPI001B315B39|nr:flavin reductase family protein [Naasia sp. SYSU D00948]